MIDFFADARAFIENPSEAPDFKQTTPKVFKSEPKPEEKPEQKELCLYTGLEVSEDGTEIYINGETFKVPDWYNKEMIKARDKKTIDMVFIHYGYNSAPADLRSITRLSA